MRATVLASRSRSLSRRSYAYMTTAEAATDDHEGGAAKGEARRQLEQLEPKKLLGVRKKSGVVVSLP